MFTLEELRKIDVEKIKKELNDTEKTLYKARFEVRTGQSKDHHVINVNKRYIAKMKTLLTERKEEKTAPASTTPQSEAKHQEPKPVTAPKKIKKTKAPKKA